MGVWIEINVNITKRERLVVTPFVGVWIEMAEEAIKVIEEYRHSLRGSVD